MKTEVEVNGFKYDAIFSKEEVNNIFTPLLEKFTTLREKMNRRILIFLAGPPAVGKSTLAIFLEKLSRERNDLNSIQSLSLDGFHYNNKYLKENNLYNIKGMPETYDIDNFKKYLEAIQYKNIKWPIYDRNLHNPIMDKVDVTADIILIEGNWLLLNEIGWRDLRSLCDYSIFIKAEEVLLKNRLIQRKIKGGLDKEKALEFYKRTDSKNIQRVMCYSYSADLTLNMLESGEYIL